MLSQQQAAIDSSQGTFRTLLLVAGCFATAMLLGILLAALVLARAMNHVSDVVVASLTHQRMLSVGHSPAPLPAVDNLEAAPAPVEQVTQRFLGAIEQLEKRVIELEQTTRTAAQQLAAGHPANGGNGGPMEFSVSALHEKQYGSLEHHGGAESASTDEAEGLLGKGLSLLNLEQFQEALVCFDRVIELSPKHAADAYVRRGMVYERLQQTEAAIESYDKAIETDDTLTLAYLYKGAICNRLQRFREALECYESALRCEQKIAATTRPASA
jgi:tetratricopeptide (TPR) repeat protein